MLHLLSVLPLLAPVLAAGSSAPAAAGQQSRYEDFEDVDPYTQGEAEKVATLGYLRFGPFPWQGSARTVEVQQVLGGADTLFVETEHFKIASTLSSYTLPNDRAERERIRAGLEALQEKLGKLKAPRRKLDPWLRLHLAARTLEDVHARLALAFDVDPTGLRPGEVWPGQVHKPRVLLAERASEFERYVGQELGVEATELYWGAWPDGSLFFGAAAEPIRERWRLQQDVAIDTQLQLHLVTGAVLALIGGYADSFYGAPVWFPYGLAHAYAREIDERWVTAGGQSLTKEWDERDGEWRRRVRDLAEIGFFADVPTMFAWVEYTDMNERDHMIAWSRVEYLMQLEGGERRLFLEGLCRRVTPGTREERAAENLRRSTEALRQGFGLTPEAFQAAWLEHVLDTYARKR